MALREQAASTEPLAAQATSPAVRLVGVRRSYGDVAAVAGVDLEIAAGEFFTLLGPSGSGKTTTLRVIAGFERPDAGRVELAGLDVTGKAPYEGDVNTVFQDYALFPHMTVVENVEYGLRVKGVPRRERRARGVDQRPHPARLRDAARRLQAVGLRQGSQRLLARGLHPDQARDGEAGLTRGARARDQRLPPK